MILDDFVEDAHFPLVNPPKQVRGQRRLRTIREAAREIIADALGRRRLALEARTGSRPGSDSREAFGVCSSGAAFLTISSSCAWSLASSGDRLRGARREDLEVSVFLNSI